MLSPVILEKAATPAVSLEEARKHLDIYGFDDDDAQIMTLVDVATRHLENSLGIIICKTKFQQDFAQFCHASRPDIYPILSVVQISYFDEGNIKVTLPAMDYQLFHTKSGEIIHFNAPLPRVFARADAVQVQFFSGFESGEVPAPLRAAILLHTASLYNFRSDLSVARPVSSQAYDALLWPYRSPRL